MAVSVIDKLNKVPLWQKATVLAVLAAGEVAFFYFSVWTPLDEKIVQLKSEYAALDRTYQEQKAVADDLATFQANTKKLEEELKVAIKQLPREKEIASLLRDIYTEGRKAGIEFNSFQPQGEAQKQLYAEVPIKLQITGQYHQVAVFFDRIGKLSRIVNVSDIDLTGAPSADAKKETSVSVNCTATTFKFLGGGS